MNSFNIDDSISEDEGIHLAIRNIENKPQNYQEWNKLAGELMEKGNYYKLLYEKSKSEYAKEKLESLYSKSIVCSDKAIELNSHSIDSWYNKGLALSNLGQYDKAIQCYDKVIEIDPDYVPVWNSKGNAFDHLGKFHESIKSYDRVLEKDPQNIIALYNKGLAFSNLRKFEEAIKCYDRVLEKDTKNIDALNAKGYALLRVGKNEAFDTVIEIDPHNTEALIIKGYILERIGKYSEAEQYYNRIKEEYLNEINIMNENAINYQKSNKYDEAIICYDRIISIDANNSNAWLKKGHLFYNLNNFNNAIEGYDRVIGLDKYKEKLKREGQEELTDKQIIEYYKTIKPSPENIDALNAKGLTLEKLEKYDDAIKIFDLVITHNPQFVIDTIIKKGDIFMKLGKESSHKYQEAEKSYNDALKRDPENISALHKLHTLYSNYTFQYDEAIAVCEQLLKNLSKSEDKLDIKISLSEDYIKNGNYKQGLKIAKETIKYIPTHFTKRRIIIKSLIIVSYLLEGKKFDGIKELNKFLGYYRNLDIDIKIEENQWNFKGLVNAINKNKDIDGATKTILGYLIDLLHGYTDRYKTLSMITAEALEKMDKRIF
jgi:tetratricopeptide (TPR) repeat protein